jgi:endoglucanase
VLRIRIVGAAVGVRQRVTPPRHGRPPLLPLLLAGSLLAGLSAGCTGAAALGTRGAVTALLRVDQSGYPTTAVKAGYVMANGALTGNVLVVNSSGKTVDTLKLGGSLGAWNGRYPYVYKVTFSGVTAPGLYTLRFGGSASPKFQVGAATSLYATDLANSLYFYENEQDGPSFVRTPLRTAPAHLNDEKAAIYKTPVVDSNGLFKGDLSRIGTTTIDASGGWWDAGDYLKFVETTSYVVTMMLDGIKAFPNELVGGSGRSDFVAGARFGLGWLMKMWNESTKTLYYQVGIGAGNTSGTILSDHDIWRLPQVDDTYGGTSATYKYIRHRPVFEAAPAGSPISPNLAGRLAAAFGLCYQVFASSDSSLADACMLDGETVFKLAKTSNVGQLLTAIPYDFYPETNWQDDLELGATELYLALAAGGSKVPGLPDPKPLDYLHAAASWAKAYVALGAARYDTLNLYDVAGLAHYELYRAIEAAGNPTGLAVTPAQLLANLATLIGIGTAQAKTEPFGYGAPWNEEDSVSLGDGLSVMASEYDSLAHAATYAAQAQGWMDNVLGANPWGVAFIVGDGSLFPHCISSQVPNMVGTLTGAPPVLDGAAVEGPSSSGTTGFLTGMRPCSVNYTQFNSTHGVFVDNEQSYNTDEPAIDLTASSFLALSWLEVSGA